MRVRQVVDSGLQAFYEDAAESDYGQIVDVPDDLYRQWSEAADALDAAEEALAAHFTAS